MASDDFDLADVTVRKDALIAGYTAITTRWAGIQGAGLGAAGIALVAYASGGLPLEPAFMVSGFAIGLVVATSLVVRAQSRVFAGSIEFLRNEIETLKRSRSE